MEFWAMSEVFEPSYTISAFCEAEGITPPTYFKLRAAGRGPREMRYGTVVRISHRARLDWQRQQENLQGEAREQQRKINEQLRARAHAAVKKAWTPERRTGRASFKGGK